MIFLIFVSIFSLINESCLENLNKLNNLDFLSHHQPQCYDNVTIHGLILARKGSKGIKSKNLIKIGGKSILRRSIETMISFEKFSAVWVSTDGEEIAEEAEKFGALVHWRAVETATDTATSLLALQEFIGTHRGVDTVALIQCTSPLLNVEYLAEAYNLLKQGFDTVFSASREFKLRWRQNPDGTTEAINFNPSERPRRQDWDGELVENGMFYFTKKKFLMKGLIQGGRIGVVTIPKYDSLEIDNEDDLKLARSLNEIRLGKN